MPTLPGWLFNRLEICGIDKCNGQGCTGVWLIRRTVVHKPIPNNGFMPWYMLFKIEKSFNFVSHLFRNIVWTNAFAFSTNYCIQCTFS